MDLNHPEMVSATTKVLNGCKSRGKVAMIMVGDQEMARKKLADGWSGVFPGADITWIINAAKEFHQLV